MLFPHAMFPTTGLNELDRLFPLVIFAIAIADVALAACAFRYDIGATVRARSIIEPWTISIAAGAYYFYSHRDGLILGLCRRPWSRHWRRRSGRSCGIMRSAARLEPPAGADLAHGSA